jgi:hypothetical protein
LVAPRSRGRGVPTGGSEVRSTTEPSDLGSIVTNLERGAEATRNKYTEKFGWEKVKEVAKKYRKLSKSVKKITNFS